MVTDLPTHEQFEKVACDLLNLAWTSAAELTHNLNLARQGWDDPEVARELSDEYWNAAQRPLATALSLVQQSMEFLLKGRIANVSAYLLLAEGWPAGCDREDVPFSKFRTIDANDLIRVHNTVAATRLDAAFTTFFNELRQLRNATTHSLVFGRHFSVREIFCAVLRTVDYLLKPRTWIDLRREYLNRDPIAVTHSTDFSPARLAQDIMVAVDVLKPAEALEFFGFDKNRRAYHCPSCIRRCAEGQLGVGEAEPKLAQLIDKTSNCTQAKCFLCGREIEVRREPCRNEGCNGNVVERYICVCLTCNCYQPGEGPTLHADG